MPRIEQAEAKDVEEVRRIAGRVFADLGNYSEILPRFFSTQGVHTFLARRGREVVGFAMLGFMPWQGGEREGTPWIADLLAIAVLPEHQRKGVGSRLLQECDSLIEQMSEWRDLIEVQLTCAASNEAGLAFFSRHGFRVVDTNHGSYAGGQEAWRLSRQLA